MTWRWTTKREVLKQKKALDDAGIVAQDGPLKQAAKQGFYNASPFTLKDLLGSSPQQIEADLRAYLDGFSDNVREILENFEFHNQIPRLSRRGRARNVDREVHISRYKPVSRTRSGRRRRNSDSRPGQPRNGTIFEDLVRRFNEENNEEAGEHWTPRDAVQLMSRLIFDPIADKIESTTYLLYDGALGTGGMLTVAEQTLQDIAKGAARKWRPTCTARR